MARAEEVGVLAVLFLVPSALIACGAPAPATVPTDEVVVPQTGSTADTGEPADSASDTGALPAVCDDALQIDAMLSFEQASPWVTPSDDRLDLLIGNSITLSICGAAGMDTDPGPGGTWEVTGVLAVEGGNALDPLVEQGLEAGSVTLVLLPAEVGVVMQVLVNGGDVTTWTLDLSCITGATSAVLGSTSCAAEVQLTGVLGTQFTHWVMGTAEVELVVR